MFQMSRGDPEYARDFYDYLVDCGALLIDGNKDNFKDNKNYEGGIKSYNFNYAVIYYGLSLRFVL